MTVESNFAIAIATLSYWFKNLAPVYQPMRRKITSNRDLHADFSRALSKLHGIDTNLDWFVVLFAPAVIGQRNHTLVFVLRHSIENRSNGVIRR